MKDEQRRTGGCCLDGTTITKAEASSFARKTLEAAHVTGAQIVDVAHNAAFKLMLALRNAPNQTQSDETFPAY